MKKSTILCLVLMFFFSSYSKSYGQDIVANDQNKRLGRGVNIIGYDKELWKDYTKGRFKEEYFKMIKEAGFSNVRINLHPFSYMNSEYRINPKWMETLDWAVKNALEADLMVILDLHEFNAMAADPVAKKEMFLSVWKQLAPRYKDQSENNPHHQSNPHAYYWSW
jgi:endoglucanase